MNGKETHFAGAERKSKKELKSELETLLNNRLISEMLYLLSGVVMVINDERQILTANQAFLNMTGVDSAEALLGMRPGEALGCIHAHKGPGGCGTAEVCASCGAALAIVTSQCTDKPVERYCALSVQKQEGLQNLYLRVIATPVSLPDTESLVLVCFQDVTAEHRWANLDKIFYHDVNNLITALSSLTQLISMNGAENGEQKYLDRLQNICDRLAQEVSVQQLLTHERGKGVVLHHRSVPVGEILAELGAIYSTHPKALHRRISLPHDGKGQILSDPGLVVRIVGNMITNALEATEEGGEIIVSIRYRDKTVGFEVWNEQYIPLSIQQRIFQRHFSTKEGFERGLGTFAMKLLGEEILGGKVAFTSSPGKGTVFTLWLPLSQNQEN